MNEFNAKIGSIEAQLIDVHNKINDLANRHFKQAPKDLHSKRGMMKMIEKRKKLLKYLKRTNFDLYKSLVLSLGIRQKGVSSGS